MVVAAWRVHRSDDFFVHWKSEQEGFELHFLAAGIALALVIDGGLSVRRGTDQRAALRIDSGAHGEKGGVEMTRLRRAMALWGRTSIPFFKSRYPGEGGPPSPLTSQEERKDWVRRVRKGKKRMKAAVGEWRRRMVILFAAMAPSREVVAA